MVYTLVYVGVWACVLSVRVSVHYNLAKFETIKTDSNKNENMI